MHARLFICYMTCKVFTDFDICNHALPEKLGIIVFCVYMNDALYLSSGIGPTAVIIAINAQDKQDTESGMMNIAEFAS